MLRSLAIAAVAALGLTLAGCGETTSPTEQDGLTMADLAGKVYLSDLVTGHTLVKGTQIRITFDDDNVGASAGCNHMGGAADIVDGRLVAEPLAMTEMACFPETKMDQDTWLADFLASEPDIALAGDEVTLTGDEASIVLSEEQDTALQGTDWSLDGLIEGDAVSSVPAVVKDAGITIEGGQILIRSGCNGAGGPVEVTDDTLVLGEIAYELKGCGDERAEVEAHFHQVLAGTVTYAIQGQSLTIMSADGTVGLMFRAG
jgi:heat shock protein HslJ